MKVSLSQVFLKNIEIFDHLGAACQPGDWSPSPTLKYYSTTMESKGILG
jgi:hypothetical protein